MFVFNVAPSRGGQWRVGFAEFRTGVGFHAPKASRRTQHLVRHPLAYAWRGRASVGIYAYFGGREACGQVASNHWRRAPEWIVAG